MSNLLQKTGQIVDFKPRSRSKQISYVDVIQTETAGFVLIDACVPAAIAAKFLASLDMAETCLDGEPLI